MKSVALLNVLILLFVFAIGLRHPDCRLIPFLTNRGKCKKETSRFSYNFGNNECVHWFYGGCGDKKNNFATKRECEAKCKE